MNQLREGECELYFVGESPDRGMRAKGKLIGFGFSTPYGWSDFDYNQIRSFLLFVKICVRCFSMLTGV